MEIILGISFLCIAFYIILKSFSGMIKSVREILVKTIKDALK